MRWLLHGNLTPAVAEALRRHGHQAQTLADAQIDASETADVLEAAHERQLDLITTDAQLVSAPFERPSPFARSIVFLQLEGGDVEQDDAVDRLFERYKRLAPGRIYTVTGSRVKVRQLPGN
jgi:hypothetical protein